MATKKYKPSFKKDHFEYLAWAQNNLIIGVDEVGRGCLAGPVVVAAAIIPQNTSNRLLKDSKLMNIAERNKAYNWIKKRCFYSYCVLHHRAIDTHNIYWATLMAMKRTVLQLLTTCPKKPSHIVVDAMPLSLENTSFHDIHIAHFSKGEKKSRSIAAASIIAKVKRDQLMNTFDSIIPKYHFEKHKGYATRVHRNKIKEYGASIIHRMSFLSDPSLTEESDHGEQQTLF